MPELKLHSIYIISFFSNQILKYMYLLIICLHPNGSIRCISTLMPKTICSHKMCCEGVIIKSTQANFIFGKLCLNLGTATIENFLT